MSRVSGVGGRVSPVSPRILLAATAALLGVSAAVADAIGRHPTPDTLPPTPVRLAQEIDRQDDHVTALELAQWIRERKPGLRVIDVRSDSEYVAYHIPSAERVPLTEIATMRPRDGETVVLYSEGGAHAAQAWVLLRAAGFERVYFLRGGLLDWLEDVMSPVRPDARVAALSRYFGGVPRADGTPLGAAATPTRPATSSSVGAVERVRRRGC